METRRKRKKIGTAPINPVPSRTRNLSTLAHLHAGSFVMWFLKSTAPSSGLRERYLAMLVLDRGRRGAFTMIPPFGPKIMTRPFGPDPLSTLLIGCSYNALL